MCCEGNGAETCPPSGLLHSTLSSERPAFVVLAPYEACRERLDLPPEIKYTPQGWRALTAKCFSVLVHMQDHKPQTVLCVSGNYFQASLWCKEIWLHQWLNTGLISTNHLGYTALKSFSSKVTGGQNELKGHSHGQKQGTLRYHGPQGYNLFAQ